MPRGSRFDPTAQLEFDAAHDWYLERSPAAAERFAVEVERVVAEVRENADLGRIVLTRPDGGAIRAMPCRGYPYVVAWLLQGEDCVILAVAHTRRRPGFWLDRAV